MFFKKFGYNQTFKGILIDTNLLLLVLVGVFDKTLIKKFKRTLKYEIEDFDKLIGIISFFDEKIYTTPNILTELTNLTDSINENSLFFKFIYKFINQFIELTNDSHTVILNNSTAFFKLGLADASIMNATQENILIITDDLPLYHFLISTSKAAINYNHLREL